jgi:hypothetical protein
LSARGDGISLGSFVLVVLLGGSIAMTHHDENAPPRVLPIGATLPLWLEEVKLWSIGRDYQLMVTRAEAEYYQGSLVSDEQWDRLGSIGGSNTGIRSIESKYEHFENVRCLSACFLAVTARRDGVH